MPRLERTGRVQEDTGNVPPELSLISPGPERSPRFDGGTRYVGSCLRSQKETLHLFSCPSYERDGAARYRAVCTPR